MAKRKKKKSRGGAPRARRGPQLWSLRQFFAAESVPFIVTIFVAAVAWAITRFADSMANAPIIEYDISMSRGVESSSVDVDLQNLTKGTTFKNLMFVLRAADERDRGRIFDARIVPKEPAWEGATKPDIPIDKHSATFLIESFHPGWHFRLTAMYTGKALPTVQVQGSDQALRLIRPSVETFFLKYEYRVIAGLLAVWAIILVSMLVSRRKAKRKKG